MSASESTEKAIQLADKQPTTTTDHDTDFITAWMYFDLPFIKITYNKAKAEGTPISTAMLERAFEIACIHKCFNMAQWVYTQAKRDGINISTAIDPDKFIIRRFRYDKIGRRDYCECMLWIEQMKSSIHF